MAGRFERSATHSLRASCAHRVARLCRAHVFAGEECFGGGSVSALARVREAVGLGASLPMVVAALLVGTWAEGAIYDVVPDAGDTADGRRAVPGHGGGEGVS